MDSANTLGHSSPRLFALIHYHQWRSKLSLVSPLSCFRSRPRSRRRNKLKKLPSTHTYPIPTSSSDSKLQTVIDLNELHYSFFDSLYHSSQTHFHRFLSSGLDALDDLQTLVTYDDRNRRVFVSCRPSTVRFVGHIVLWSILVIFAFRVLLSVGSRFRNQFRREYAPMVRRDRSLGGKEVVVGRSVKDREGIKKKKKKNDFFGVLSSPVSMDGETGFDVQNKVSKNRTRIGEKLPSWWPVTVSNRVATANRQEYQREANRLIRVIMDKRMSGQDITAHDIIELRHICRTSGVQVSFNTTNMRDSFYRTSVDFVLNVCSRAPTHSAFVQIDDEDVPQFVVGLAENIGLENVHAARIVSAAVAARTHSRFLQAWALEMQGKHLEAGAELAKICIFLHIFPPEESSPEMEMVALGLEKHLKVEERQHLMNLLTGLCGEEIHRSAAEALGLVHANPPNVVGDALGNGY